MIRDFLAYVYMPLIVSGIWFVSLRRTPWATIWGLLSVAYILGLSPVSAVIAHGMSHGHHVATVPGAAAAIGVGFGCVPFAIGCGTEISALNRLSDVYVWRHHVWERRSKRQPRRWRRRQRPDEKWKVLSAVQSDLTVEVYVAQNDTRRLIGMGDPVQDPEGYMDLKVRAQSIAEQLTSLKVGNVT